MHENVWSSGGLDYSELPNILPSDVTGEYFAEGTEISKILGSLMGEEVENLEDHGCPKFKIWLMKKYRLIRVTHSDKRPHVTTQSRRQKCLIIG